MKTKQTNRNSKSDPPQNNIQFKKKQTNKQKTKNGVDDKRPAFEMFVINKPEQDNTTTYKTQAINKHTSTKTNKARGDHKQYIGKTKTQTNETTKPSTY